MNDDLKKLLAEATSLPWSVSNTRSPADVYAHVVSEDMYIADCEWDSKFGPADAALIVAAVNALPGLLERVKRQRETIVDVMASLAAAISLLERGGKRGAPSQKMFDIMIADYKASLERARAALNQEPGTTEVFQELAKKQEPLGAEFEAAIGDRSTLYET